VVKTAADISQLRAIIVVCSLVALSFLLISWIPDGFYSATQEGRTFDSSEYEYFSAIDLTRYGDTFNFTMDGTGCTLKLGLYSRVDKVGGHTFRFVYPQANSSVYDRILQVSHCETWIIPQVYWDHPMTFFHEGIVDLGTILTETELNTYADDLVFEIRCSHLSIDIYFGYDESTYSMPVEAFDHNALTLLIGLEWDELNTSMSAWDFVASIMFFNLPNTHWMITAIIAVPLWIALLYAAVTIIITILDLLPFT